MSNYREFDFGSTVTLAAEFKVSDVLTDPTTVALQVEDPSGDVSNYSYPASITKDAVGKYSKQISCSESGEWEHEWTGTGTVEAVDTARFLIKRQGV